MLYGNIREIRGVRQARKHMTWYAKGFVGAADLRGKLSLMETVQQGLDLIDGNRKIGSWL